MNASAIRLITVFLLCVEIAIPSVYCAESAAKVSLNSLDADHPRLAGQFSGRVTDIDGQPISGADIYVIPLSDSLDGKLVDPTIQENSPVRAETNADGRFEFVATDMILTDLDGLPTNRVCLVVATAPGYGPDAIEIRGRTRTSPVRRLRKGTELEFHLAKDDVPIQGQFLGPDGQPVFKANVQIGSIMVPKNRDLDAHLEREINRSIHSSFLTGGGVDYERWLSQPGLLPGLTATAQTDVEGRFTLSGIGRDRFVSLKISEPTIVDTHVSFMTRTVDDIPTRVGKDRDKLSPDLADRYLFRGANFTFPLKSGRTISGEVRDRATQAPLAGMLVGVGHAGYPRDGIRGHQTVTEENGRFCITGLEMENEKWAITAVSPPGMTYQAASIDVTDDSPVIIECEPGIPYRLKVIDEKGQHVKADVSYFEVRPNAYAPKLYCFPSHNPISTALERADGIYEGFVLPGPGVLLIKTPGRDNYLPPRLDVQAFFDSQEPKDYGSHDTVHTVMGATRQNSYPALVLVNPQLGSKPLELSATVVAGKPRQVSLIDPEGQPIVGAKTQGLTESHDHEPLLRAASFPLLQLHPDRMRRIIFRKEDRKMIGYLETDGKSDTPLKVRMQPWASISGRLVDWQGKPLPIGKPKTDWEKPPKLYAEITGDPEFYNRLYSDVDAAGRFKFDKLIPGLAYNATVYQKMPGLSVTAIEKVTLKPGEVRDVGDIKITTHSIAMLDMERDSISATVQTPGRRYLVQNR